MAESIKPQSTSTNIYTGYENTIEPEWLSRNIVRSHGVHDRFQRFYCTTYGTNYNLDQYYSPQIRMGKYATSGWTQDPTKQPLRSPPDYKRSYTGDGDDMVSTIYSSSFRQHPLTDIEFTNIFPCGRPSYPDNSIRTNVSAIREKSPEAGKIAEEKPKNQSVYSAEVATAPKEWMEKEFDADHGTVCDKQSPYLKGNPCHSYFVYPELMKSNVQQKTTVYQQSYPASNTVELENMLACRKSGDPLYRTQFNGFEGAIWQHELPNRSRFPPVGEKDIERWKTQYNETHKWDDWRATEDTMQFRKPVGEAPIVSSGYVINEPEVSILSPEFHELKNKTDTPAKWS